MTPEQFAYWLQGFMELSGESATFTPAQVKMIREHLATVFVKVTPPLAPPPLSPYIAPAPPVVVGPFSPTTDDRFVVTCSASPDPLSVTLC